MGKYWITVFNTTAVTEQRKEPPSSYLIFNGGRLGMGLLTTSHMLIG